MSLGPPLGWVAKCKLQTFAIQWWGINITQTQFGPLLGPCGDSWRGQCRFPQLQESLYIGTMAELNHAEVVRQAILHIDSSAFDKTTCAVCESRPS